MRKHLIIIICGLILSKFAFGQKDICNSNQLLIKNRVKNVSIFLIKNDTTKNNTERLSMIFHYDTLGRCISIDHYNTAKMEFNGTEKFFYKGNSFDGIKIQDISATGKIIEERVAKQDEIYNFNSHYYGERNCSFILNNKGLYSMFLIYANKEIAKDNYIKTILRFEYNYY